MKSMTIAEAAQMWCPDVRLVVDTSTGRVHSNRPPEFGDNAFYCMGPKCAAWQFRDLHTLGNKFYVYETDCLAIEEPERPKEVPDNWTWSPFEPVKEDPAGWAEPEEERRRRARGYCGRNCTGALDGLYY